MTCVHRGSADPTFTTKLQVVFIPGTGQVRALIGCLQFIVLRGLLQILSFRVFDTKNDSVDEEGLMGFALLSLDDVIGKQGSYSAALIDAH